MKKIVFLMFVIVSVIAANAQTSPNNSIITFSASDESYDIEARHNFVDVYFSDGTHFFLNYAIRYEHVKNGITTMTYMLTYHEGFKGNLVAQVRKSVDGPPGMLTEDHHHTVHEERQVCYSSHLRPKSLHL